MPPDSVQQYLFGLSLGKLFAGALGAFVSLQFVRGSRSERAVMAVGGVALSYYAAAPIAQWLGMGNAEGLAGFLVGVFGMSITAKAYEALQALDAARVAQDLWQAMKHKMGG
jgi:hypothetical protein